MRAFKYLYISHNALKSLQTYGKLYQNSLLRKNVTQSKKILEEIDISDNQFNELLLNRSTFFQFIASKELHLNNNEIESIPKNWLIFDKSLRILDLKKNYIEILNVSI